MNVWIEVSLTFLLSLVGVPTAVDSVVVHRCEDAKGHITLQDDVCPKGTQDKQIVMLRPKDAPPVPRPAPVITPAPVMQQFVVEEEEPLIPPPPMYRCTTYDGDERLSESYDPNPRCEPMVIYFPQILTLGPEYARTCRWVKDSCVLLSVSETCVQWRKKKIEAESDLRRAFRDTAVYRKSELARIKQIVDQSCR